MKNSYMLTATACLLCLAGTAFAQVDEAAKTALMDAQAAVNKIEGATYSIKKSGTGMLKDLIDLSGQVKMMRAKGAAAPTTLIVGRMKEPGKADRKLNVSDDGQNVSWLSAQDQVLYTRARNDSKAAEELSTAKEFSLVELVSGSTFDNMIKLPKLSKQGVDNVAGEVCDLIVGETADGSRTFTYAISVADRLPRRVEMAANAAKPAAGEKAGEKIAMITEITNLKPATLKADDFKIALPEGYIVNALSPNPSGNNGLPVPNLGPTLGAVAPDFKIVDATGKEHTPATLKGNVVVLQFFGTMFKASTPAAAELQIIADEFKGKPVAFVGLSCREPSPGSGADFFKSNKLAYTLIPSADAAATAFNIKGYPSYVILSPEGKVSSFFQDSPGKEKLASAISDAMK